MDEPNLSIDLMGLKTSSVSLMTSRLVFDYLALALCRGRDRRAWNEMMWKQTSHEEASLKQVGKEGSKPEPFVQSNVA